MTALSLAALVALLLASFGGCAGPKSGGAGAAAGADAAGVGAAGGAAVGTLDPPRPAGPPRALSPDDLVLDFSSAAEVLSLWLEPDETIRERAAAIAKDLPVRTLREYLSTISRTPPTDAEVARAIAFPDSGVGGFGLEPSYRERAALDSLVRALVLRSTSLRKRVAGEVGEYVPRMAWGPVRVYFVISTRYLFDAVTLDRSLDGGPAPVVFNLSEALGYGGSTQERAEIVERVVAHETFHAAVRQFEYGRPGWERYHEPLNAMDYITRVLLDEGVAHYIDWQERAGSDSLFGARVGGRERKAFDQLALACKRLWDPGTDPGARGEILGLAATGPLWSKYGAISGMFAAYRIEHARGRDSLRAAVASGPLEFLRMYRDVAAADTTLKKWPKQLG